jgi:hypothetical protein
MAIDLNPKKANVDEINKKPLAYMLGVAIVMLGVFVTLYFTSNTKRNDDCKEQIAAINKRADKSDADAQAARDELIKFLLSEAERKKDEKAKADSLVKKVVGDKAKHIVNSNK